MLKPNVKEMSLIFTAVPPLTCLRPCLFDELDPISLPVGRVLLALLR
jgi:hypothetical protein